MGDLSTNEQAIYLYALRLLTGIGPKHVLLIARSFPQLQIIPELSQAELKGKLGVHLSQKLFTGISSEWKNVFSAAQGAMDRHRDKGIVPLPITCNEYPILLKQIEDAPAILYAKGDVSVLSNIHAVAIVGTREPTARGADTAHLAARHFARFGYVIISGLAKGIDTAGHQGTIAAGGKTIAVFATPLDKVYPAENRKLAEQIAKESGVLVSELPLGTASWKGAFVERDRIQSGLSLGVIPIQTGIEGGTMHTVRFAQAQRRLLFCPQPPEEEKQAPQYEGVWWLHERHKAFFFQANRPEVYEQLYLRLEEHRNKLLGQTEIVPQQQELTVQQGEEVEPSLKQIEPSLNGTMQISDVTEQQPAEKPLPIAAQTEDFTTLPPEANEQSPAASTQLNESGSNLQLPIETKSDIADQNLTLFESSPKETPAKKRGKKTAKPKQETISKSKGDTVTELTQQNDEAKPKRKRAVKPKTNKVTGQKQRGNSNQEQTNEQDSAMQQDSSAPNINLQLWNSIS